MTAPVALVTGANRGIGLEVARQLAGRGHQVAICARNAADAEAAALGIGAGTAGFVLDITDPVSVDAAVAAVVAHFGRLDVVVNNAGGHYDDGATISRVTDEDLRDALEINTFGALRVTRAAIPHLRASGHGRVVNVSSRSGTFSATWGDAPAYAVSKAGLIHLTRCMAVALAPETARLPAVETALTPTEPTAPTAVTTAQPLDDIRLASASRAKANRISSF